MEGREVREGGTFRRAREKVKVSIEEGREGGRCTRRKSREIWEGWGCKRGRGRQGRKEVQE